MKDPTQRFSSRVENYVKYRPHYPTAIIDTLAQNCGLSKTDIVADVGSGTGLLSDRFLQNGNRLYAVEPNPEMRAAGEAHCAHYPNFVSVAGQAEATTLNDNSVDFVVAGQAFHWFDQAKAKQEFSRILKSDGWVVLIWQDRQTQTTPFLQAYEQLLHDYTIDYVQVNHKQISETVLANFFGANPLHTSVLSYQQIFDYDGLKGRLMSSSYTPEAGHPSHAPMIKQLLKIFQQYQQSGTVQVEYDTRLFYGQLLAQ